jgi:hypothetical protein
LVHELLETRALLEANPFHNDFWPEDVDNNLHVAPRDALYLINDLNANGSRQLLASGMSEGEDAARALYLDVSGDGNLSAVDVLRVVNTINDGEGEIAPTDVVGYSFTLTDTNGIALPTNVVAVGQTFVLHAYVKDNRGVATAKGVFAGYADVLVENAAAVAIRYGETQRLVLESYDDYALSGGTFKLSYQGNWTGNIEFTGVGSDDAASIRQALESLPGIGAGNVKVAPVPNYPELFNIQFVMGLGERDVSSLGVDGQLLTLEYTGSGTPGVVQANSSVTDNFIPADILRADTFLSSFTFPVFVNGCNANNEAGGPAGSVEFGEVGGFSNAFNDPTPRVAKELFNVSLKAVQSGVVSFSGNYPVDEATDVGKETLVYSSDGPVAQDKVGFAPETGIDTPLVLTVVAPITVGADTKTVAEDSGTTAINVLANDAANVGAGGVAPLVLVSVANLSPAGSATIAVASGQVNFTPAANFNGQVTFTYQVRDSKTPTPNTATGTVTVTVDALNDAPVVTIAPLPGPIDEDEGSVTLPAGTIAISDVDAGPTALLTATVAVSGGTVTLGSTTGLTFTTGDGTADANMVFTGTLTALNAAATNGTFNTAQNFNGTATVGISVNDGGATGSGGAKVGANTLSITVTPLNDPPVNTVPTTTQTVIETDILSFAPPISTTDVEVLAESKSVQVNLGVNSGKLNLATTANLTNLTGLNTGAVSFRGSLADVNAALATLTYQANTFPQSDTLTVTTSDLGTSPLPVMTDTDQVPIAVLPSSRPSAVPDSVTVAEESGPTTVDVLANDIDVNSTVGPTNLIITTASDPAGGAVVVAGDGKSLTYQPDLNFFGSDTFTYTIVSTLPDQGDGPSIGTVQVNVSGINDSPTITAAPTGVTTDEDQAFTFSGGNQLAVADVDADAATTNPGVLVTLSVGHGTLAPGGTANVTVGGQNTGTLTIRGKVADVNAALNNTTYTPTQDWDQADALQFTVDDQGNTGGGAASHTDTRAIPIAINPLNDAPTMKAPANAATMENVALSFPAGGANEISVADVDNASLTVDLTVTNGTLTLKPPTTGLTTVTGDNTGTVHIVGSLASLNGVLNGLTYNPTTAYEGDATLIVTAHDDEPLSVSKTVSIVVSGINDPPEITSPGNQTINEDTPLTFTGNLSVADKDGGAFDENVGLSVTRGIITVNAAAGVTITGNGSATVALVGPLSAINAALDGAQYQAPANFNTPDTGISPVLTITANDNGHTGTGGPQTDTKSLTITVSEVNDSPTAVDDYSPTNRLLILQNSANNALSVLANDYFDPPDKGETLSITNVDTTNAHGTVTVQGNQLLYTPTAGYLGNAEIVYTIRDRTTGGLTDTATVYVQVVDFVPSDVSGHVYWDSNGNGKRVEDNGDVERGIGGVVLTLTGVNIQGNNVSLTTRTDANGQYKFEDVLPCQQDGTYQLTETQPVGLVDGEDDLGNQPGSEAGNDAFNVFLPLFGYAAGDDGTGNNFGELALNGQAAWLAVGDLLSSQDPDSGTSASQGMLFAMNAAGDLEWYVNLGGWDGYVPGHAASATDLTLYHTEIVGASLDVTHRDPATQVASALTATACTDQQILQQSVGTSKLVRMVGATADWTMQAAAGEGETTPQTDDGLNASANAAQYAQQVDAVFSELGDLI